MKLRTVRSSLGTTQMQVRGVEKRLTSPCLGMLNLESLALALADSDLVAGTPLYKHDSIHVRMPFSQIILPSPSPSESKSLLYTSVSFLLSCIQGHHCHLSKFHIYVSILYWCFSFWLTSLCIIGSSFIHLNRTDSSF